MTGTGRRLVRNLAVEICLWRRNSALVDSTRYPRVLFPIPGVVFLEPDKVFEVLRDEEQAGLVEVVEFVVKETAERNSVVHVAEMVERNHLVLFNLGKLEDVSPCGSYRSEQEILRSGLSWG